MRKKPISLLLAAALCFTLRVPALAAGAVRSPQNLSVDGETVECEKYNINNSNYFKLRDLAYLLDGTGSQFAVGWDAATSTVSITTGAAYTPNGTELVRRGDCSGTARRSAQTIKIDGEVRDDLTVYNIGDSNFFQLRELGGALGFGVGYDAATNTAIVTSAGAGTPGNSASAAVIRLMRAEGTVSVLNAEGQELSFRESMRLYSGISIVTQEKSRAGMNLDDTKAATLRDLSEAGIRKDGRKLELRLVRGGLFFKVTKPLEADESFEIRTSTIALGIRGTSGYVEVLDAHSAFVLLTSGHAVITAADPATSAEQTAEIAAGHGVTVVLDGDGVRFGDTVWTESELPRFVCEELADDPELLRQVAEETGYDPAEIAARAAGEEDGEEESGTIQERCDNADGSYAILTVDRASGRVVREEHFHDDFHIDARYSFTAGSPVVGISYSEAYSGDSFSFNASYTMQDPDNRISVAASKSYPDGAIYYEVLEYNRDSSMTMTTQFTV